MLRVTLSCFAVVLTLGCTSQEEPKRGVFPPAKPAVERAQPTKKQLFIDRPEPREITRPELADEEPEKKKERDLNEELRLAVGAPVDCVRDFESNDETTIRIPVSATVRPTGMVIQPTASGTGLSSAALKCVEQRVGLIKLEELNEPHSKKVSAVIEIDYVPPKTLVEEAPPVADPELRNVKEPLPKRAEIAPSGRPIYPPAAKPITARSQPKDPTGPAGKPIRGPKPRPIDGYDVDENAQEWR